MMYDTRLDQQSDKRQHCALRVAVVSSGRVNAFRCSVNKSFIYCCCFHFLLLLQVQAA